MLDAARCDRDLHMQLKGNMTMKTLVLALFLLPCGLAAQIINPPSGLTAPACTFQQTITTASGWNTLSTCAPIGVTPAANAIIETHLVICGNPSGANAGTLALNLWVNGGTTASTGGITMATSSTCYVFDGKVALAGAANAWNVWSLYGAVNSSVNNLGLTAVQTSTISASTVIQFEGNTTTVGDKYVVSGWQRIL